MREGDEGRFFALIVEGQVAVTRDGPGGPQQLARAGRGSVLGELALLRGRPRSATVSAMMPTVALIGGTDAFASLLALPGVLDRIRRIVSGRLAENARPVHAALDDGTGVLLRPLLPSDRETVAAAVRDLSVESRRRRFFSAGQPSELVIDYLVEIDYVDHFAWLVVDARAPSDAWGAARYIRHQDKPECAEAAVTVTDAQQGRGLGALMLGAIGAAASVSGIARFTGSLQWDNPQMRAVLSKAGAAFAFGEPGVMSAEFTVDDAASLLDEPLRHDVQSAARDIVTAAGLALAQPATS
jgi:CRP-like cAMP-binding protein